MSRLFDRILRRLGKLHEEMDGVTVISGEEVAEYYFLTTSEPLAWDDIPNVAPPFHRCFIEAPAPRQAVNDGQISAWPYPSISHFGVLVKTIEGYDTLQSLMTKLYPDSIGPLNEIIQSKGGWENVRWALDCYLYVEGGHQIRLPLTELLLVDHDGRAIWSVFGLKKEEAVSAYGAGIGTDINAAIIEMIRSLKNLLHALLLCFAFMHCKNVATQEHHPDPALQKKSLRKYSVPLTSYYTLEIDAMKEILRTEGNVDKHGLKQALGYCRGHFKSYKEKGLFGKPELTGNFWCPPHLRGKREQGVIVKDYEVTNPGPVPPR